MPTDRQLFVLRHAKSSWDDPALADHDRPLAPRGRRAVKLLAEYIRANHIEPAQVLCSSARRTRETYDGISPGGELLVEPELYEARAQRLLERLRRVPDPIPSVMVIGHNPALHMLVLELTAAEGGDLEPKFPTGALATLRFARGWSQLAPGTAELVDLIRPRDLH